MKDKAKVLMAVLWATTALSANVAVPGEEIVAEASEVAETAQIRETMGLTEEDIAEMILREEGYERKAEETQEHGVSTEVEETIRQGNPEEHSSRKVETNRVLPFQKAQGYQEGAGYARKGMVSVFHYGVTERDEPKEQVREVTDEPQTSEERTETPVAEETVQELPTEAPQTEEATSQDLSPVSVDGSVLGIETPAEGTPLYTVNGEMLDENIQNYLFAKLCEQDIGWFMPYAILIAYQESRYDIYAVSPNGRDQGLFQYRTEYYPGLNPFDPYQEIDLFVSQMAARAAAGCTTAEMISRHMMSDYGEYYQVYVDQVMQWEATLQRVQ